jgi:HEAT repeat protein
MAHHRRSRHRRVTADRSIEIRCEAAEALGRLLCKRRRVSGPEAGRALQQALSRDRSSLARVGHYEALASIGHLAYVDQLLDLLRSRRYHVRCATANALARLPLPADDRGRAARALREALRHEPTVAARSTMTASLRDLRRRHAR